MRVRKKKNTDKRLQACSAVLINSESEKLLCTKDLFEKDNEINIEIGCGKGGFVTAMATQYPFVNFIAIEKLREIIVVAAEKTVMQELTNVKLLNIDAQNLLKFLPQNSVSKIYLNFSDPWTKNRNVTRRLTDKKFLDIYKNLLKPDGKIIQKTDNRELFEFSLKMLKSNGFELNYVTYDLHNEKNLDNVITEYEQKFIDEGKPIHKVIATKIYE